MIITNEQTLIANLERENDRLRMEVARLKAAPNLYQDHKDGKARLFTVPFRPERPDGHPQNPWGKDEI